MIMAGAAWVIESENGMYLGESVVKGRPPRLGFVSGHEKALRFARKEDADSLLRMFPSYGLALHENAIGVCEHIWSDNN